MGMVSSIIMQTILATVLPGIVEDLGGAHLYGWVFSGYLIASTVTIPIFAKFADLYGRKRFYLAGMMVFLIGSVFSGTAGSMTQLVIYRLIQGLGAGALAPAAIAMISDLFPVEERGKMMGILAGVQVLANVAGPLTGGIIADKLGWQWAFFANLPTGLLAVILVAIGFSDSYKVSRGAGFSRVDFTGGLLLGISIVLFIQGFQVMGAPYLSHWETGFILLLSVFFFAVFLWQEKRHPDPVVSPGMIAIKNVNVSLISTFLLGAVLYGTIVVLPIYGQALFGETATQGGKLLLPFTLGMGVGGIFGGRLTKTFQYASLAVGGWAVVAVGFLLLAISARMDFEYIPLVAIVLVTGLGLGAALPVFLLSGQNAVAENQRGVVGGLLQISRNLGGAIGIPVFTGFIVPSHGKMLGANGQGAYAALFLLLSLGSVAGIAVGLRFAGSAFSDRKAESQ